MRRRALGAGLFISLSILYVVHLDYKTEGLKRPKIDEYRPSVVYSDCDGRLGNQISNFASLLVFHKMYGLTLHLHQHQVDLLARYFQSDAFDAFREDIPESFGQLDLEYEYDKLKNISLNVYNRLAINIGKYPHALALYREHLAEINSELRLKKEYVDEANEILKEIAKDYTDLNLIFVGLHVRRSDYKKYMKKKLKKKHIRYVNETYFKNGIKEFKKRFEDDGVAVFVAVSDEDDWIEEHLSVEKDVFIASKVLNKTSKDASARDFALLCQCNHSLLSYGSFGQWAALRTGGQAILPKETMALSQIMLDPGAAIKNNITNWTFI